MKIIAVDPGKTTGIAVWNDNLNGHQFISWEVPGGLVEAEKRVRGLLQQGSVLVFEKFVISSSTVKKDLTEAYTALYINGAIQVAAADKGCSLVVTHTPKDKEWGLPFLKALGWYTPGLGGHANDAAAHLLKYLADSHQMPAELLTKIIDLEL